MVNVMNNEKNTPINTAETEDRDLKKLEKKNFKT
jgi:hypothetical protein